MIRSFLRRPVLSAALSLAVLSAGGATYAVSTNDPAEAATATAAAPTTAELAAADYSVARDQGRRLSAQADVAQRAADDQAHAEYLVWQEQEQARKAAEAERLAAEEAERQAQAAREAEAARQAEEASRSASRDPRSAARALLADHGWSSSQFSCLDSLWQKESGWKHTADNPTSSAYGIPQALPGSKMSSAGGDWKTNPVTQIRWGLDYISDVYGSPCSAWSHSKANNWY